MSLLLENDLSLDNDSFSQELDVSLDVDSFAATKKRRNSRRTRKPVAIKAAEKRVRRAGAATKKARTHLRVVRNRFT